MASEAMLISYTRRESMYSSMEELDLVQTSSEQIWASKTSSFLYFDSNMAGSSKAELNHASIFNGENYEFWTIWMKTILKSHGLGFRWKRIWSLIFEEGEEGTYWGRKEKRVHSLREGFTEWEPDEGCKGSLFNLRNCLIPKFSQNLKWGDREGSGIFTTWIQRGQTSKKCKPYKVCADILNILECVLMNPCLLIY